MSQSSEYDVNGVRYLPGQTAGHYESFFLRANHPTDPLAFWIRYTIFSPQGHPENAIGELWAIYFDGVSGSHVAVRQEFPFADCTFERTQLAASIGSSHLHSSGAQGSAALADHTISWELSFSGTSAPLFLLPLSLYKTRFPQAKSLVPLPLANFSGRLTVDGSTIEVANWVGSQNHNWGSKHTDLYAWGQVAGFDNAPDTFLEVATARLKLGALWTPFFTPLVLRHHRQEITLNSMVQTIRARASMDGLSWKFRSETSDVRVDGTLSASPEAFVGLRYANPPGGSKICLNSKIAACELTITDKRSHETETLICRQRAAFELLSDDNPQPIRIYTDTIIS